MRTHADERYLPAAREPQQTDEFKTRNRLRSAIEPKQSELVGHGLRELYTYFQCGFRLSMKADNPSRKSAVPPWAMIRCRSRSS